MPDISSRMPFPMLAGLGGDVLRIKLRHTFNTTPIRAVWLWRHILELSDRSQLNRRLQPGYQARLRPVTIKRPPLISASSTQASSSLSSTCHP